MSAISVTISNNAGAAWTAADVTKIAAVPLVTDAAISPTIPSDIVCSVPAVGAKDVVIQIAYAIPDTPIKWSSIESPV